MTSDPLILTLALDEASFAFFDSLRRRWFPPERNLIPAHLTLFHHLPGDELAAVLRDIAETCRRQAPLTLEVTGLRSLGRGVAYTLESADLVSLRASLASTWAGWLSAQDRHGYRPHVTVQNKVEPSRARELLADLTAEFVPFTVTGEGLQLWRYRGGPWEAVRGFAFEGDGGHTLRHS